MEIAILILAILILIALIAVLYFLLRKKGGAASAADPAVFKAIADLQAETKTQMQVLSETLSLKMGGAIDEKMSAQIKSVSEFMASQAKANQESLASFQTQIAGSLDTKTAAQMEAVREALAKQAKANQDTITALQDALTKSLDAKVAAQIDTLAKQAKANQDSLATFQNAIQTSLTKYITDLATRLDDKIKVIDEKVDKSLSDGFKSASDSMSSLQKELGSVHEAQRNIAELQSQIVSLKGILSNNQEKGRYGEWQLEMIMANTFGETKGQLYDLQYVLEEGKRPDAVVFLDAPERHQILCIDSKFSLVGYEDLFNPGKALNEAEQKEAKAKFKGAIETRIDETSKYITPGKTVGSAIMFIPNDGIFAYIQNEFPETVEYARGKKVVLASPTILQPLMASFRVIQIDADRARNIEKINASLTRLAQEFVRFQDRWAKYSKQIKTVLKSNGEFDTTVDKISKRFKEVTNGEYALIESSDDEAAEDGEEE